MRAAAQTFRSRTGALAMGGMGIMAAAAPRAMAQDAPAPARKPQHQARAVEEIVVTGVRPLLGDKLPVSVQDTPQSLTVVTAALMADQAVNRLEDALMDVPGITLNAGEGAARGDTVNIRGFPAFNDFFLDGVRDAAVYNRDSFDLASVEVIKGPSAVLFGRGSTGGAINQVSKAPELTPFATTALDVGSNDEIRDVADVDFVIGPSAAFRLNAMGETSGVAGRDLVRNRRWGVAPAFSFGLGESTTLTLAWLHQQEDDVPDTGIPFVGGRPAPVPRGAFFGLASDRTIGDDDIVTVQMKHDFSQAITLSNTLRHANYRFGYQFDAPNFGTQVPSQSTPLADILVGRDAPDSAGLQSNLTDQLELSVRFRTGPASHTLVAGLDASRETADIDRYLNPFNSDNAWIAQTPLLDPDPFEARPAEPIASIQDTTANAQAAYLIDTLSLGQSLDIMAGLRFDRFAAYYSQLTRATGAVLPLSHIDNLGSPRAALVYRPTPDQSLYLSYGASFDPSAEALALTTKTADLGPVKAKTYEAGAKTLWLDGQLLVTGAAFHTEVENAQTNDPDNPTLTVLEGNERVNGFELGAVGHIAPELDINLGCTWLDGRTIASGTPAFVGKIMPNLARNAVNLWAEYRLSGQWEVGFGGNYLGSRFADPGNTATVPAYVMVNAMVSWRVSPNLTLQLNVLNLANRLYYDAIYYTSAAENHVIPGPGRTLRATARVGF